MIYRVIGARAKRESCEERECVVRAKTQVPETALVPETRERDRLWLEQRAQYRAYLWR